MAIMMGLLLVLFSAAVVAYPFLKARRPAGAASFASLEELAERRRAIYSEIRTLELEHDLGKLEEVDYLHRLRSYKLAAATTFREQDGMETRLKELDSAVEEEVAAMRRARKLEWEEAP